jgi:hypothetical protein
MSLILVLQPYAKLIYTSLGIILDVPTFLKFSHAYCDICVHQAATSGTSDGHDGLLELFESIEHFLKRLDIYTKVPSTPVLDEMVIKILMELLSTLASATKELKQGQPSKSVLTDVLRYSMQCRDICKKTLWRKGR